jgi:hypothetical protein
MKIITSVVNNPIFIELQDYLLKKYVRGGDYEFIVFNDAKKYPDYTNDGDINIRDEIIRTCERLGIRCINMDNEKYRSINNAAIRTSIAMNEIYKYQMENPDRYLIIDSDMFLIDYMDINKYDGYNMAIVLQSRDEHRYMWNGLIYMDMRDVNKFRDMNWFLTEKTDVGGMTRECLERYMKMDEESGYKIPTMNEIRWNKDGIYNTNNIYYIRHLWSLTWDKEEMPSNLGDREELMRYLMEDMRNRDGKYFCEIYDNIFLHYRCGGNWKGEGMSFHREMTEKLRNILMI